VLLKAIRRLSGTSGSEDFYFFDEDAVGWVHSTLVGVRRQGLDRLSNASAEDLTAGCRLVRENFRESSLDLGAFAKLRGLIVDLDNTLFRTQEAVPSIADLVKTIKKYYELDSLSDLEKRLWREGVSGILKDLRLRSGASAYEAETAVWGAYECLEIKNPIPMIPGWSALAKRLEKGDLKSALLTSGVWELQARKIKSVRGLQRVFRPIVIDDERCPLGKQRLIGAMLSEWNIEPRQVLIVGDNLKAEIAYGRDFGCKVAHVCVNGVCKSCETDLCCQDLKEVVSLLG
jgi:FMN phosphatase YigB (HAD superfamily)